MEVVAKSYIPEWNMKKGESRFLNKMDSRVTLFLKQGILVDAKEQDVHEVRKELAKKVRKPVDAKPELGKSSAKTATVVEVEGEIKQEIEA